MAYLIYRHINKFNGKSYVGLTSQKATRRWRNGFGYKESPIFYAAIKKYGFDNFYHEIIEDNIPTKTLANEREQYWIAYYHTWIYDPYCNGYNSTQGGTCNNTTAIQKKVFQLDQNKNILAEFESVSEAARTFNTSPDRITRCCGRKRGYLTVGGFYWCFAAEYDAYQTLGPHTARIREVVRISEAGEICYYKSATAAGKSVGRHGSQISKICGKSHKLLGYNWYYKEDYENEKRKNSN